MTHDQPHVTPQPMPSLEDLDVRNPPTTWPDYLLAPIPADSRVWKNDNQYALHLLANSFGGVNPIAALAKSMAEVPWEKQMSPDALRPSMTHVQAVYQHHYVKWRDSLVSLRLQRRDR